MNTIIATFLLHELHLEFLAQQLQSQEANYPNIYHLRHDGFTYIRNYFF